VVTLGTSGVRVEREAVKLRAQHIPISAGDAGHILVMIFSVHIAFWYYLVGSCAFA